MSKEMHTLPAVSIILPVHCLITPAKKLECRLRLIIEKTEEQLRAHYSPKLVIPVIEKLEHLSSHINYETNKKGIAIFVSPGVEKVYYLDSDVNENITIDEFFEIHEELFKAKKGYRISCDESD